MPNCAGLFISKAKSLNLRRAKSVGRFLSKEAGMGRDEERSTKSVTREKRSNGNPSCWVPHRRTGIYFPEGHERVMDDVPDGAASVGPSYWLRDVDGVDRPAPETIVTPLD